MLYIKKLSETAKLPFQATEFSAGYDLFADESKRIHDRAIISTGIAVKIPVGYVGIVKSRSSMAAKCIDTQAGVIDADYVGELKIVLSNAKWPYEVARIARGDKIAQLLIVPCLHVGVTEVKEFEETERGSGGFGSTGE